LPIEGLETSGRWVPEAVETARRRAGFPESGFAKSGAAKGWELASDYAMVPDEASAYLATSPKLVEQNPWLLKVPPETVVNDIDKSTVTGDLGFSHLIDELRNATNPASGLPPELLLKYESLPKVSVPQAVQRVSDINAWRAAQKAEADAAKANNAATVLHKEYPDKGFRWVELKAPDEEAAFAAGHRAALDPATGDMRGSARAALEDALKYEGDTMRHCVGGYCPDVLEGRSRIFSLRDAKGQPHVTIETAPNQSQVSDPSKYVRFSDLTPEQVPLFNEYVRAGEDPLEYFSKLKTEWLFNPESGVMEKASRVRPPESIIQIKGKSNLAPNAEYLPFVQDFVKSGKWSDVGDLRNAGLHDLESSMTLAGPVGEKVGMYPGDVKRALQAAGAPRYLSVEDAIQLLKPAEGYASGGLVNPSTSGYNPARVTALADALSAELFPQ